MTPTFQPRIVVAASLALPVAAMAQDARFFALGNVDGEPGCNDNGCYLSDAPRVSADGRVVYGASFIEGFWSAVPNVPFRWTIGAGIEAIGPEFGPGRLIQSVNSDGSRVLGQTWQWTAIDGFEDISARLPAFGTGIVGASADTGTVVYLEGLIVDERPFVLELDSSDPPRELITPDIGQERTGLDFAVSRDGSTVGGRLELPDFKATPASWPLDGDFFLPGDLDPGERSGGVVDFSDDGSVAVGFSRQSGFGWAGFRWTADTGIVSLAETSDQETFSPARAVNADGSIIVGQTRTFGTGSGDAYLWTEDLGLTILQDYLIAEFGLGSDLAGWSLEEATDVSADGRVIVGNGLNPDGILEAWVVVLPGSCRADFDGDGELTIFDFLAFQTAFDAGDTAADFDGDGRLTIFDFLAFQSEFDEGCV